MINLTYQEPQWLLDIQKNSVNYPRGLDFSKALFEGLILGGACIWRKVCISKSARLILGGKLVSENRLGWLIVERKFMPVILQKVFTETSLEDVDLSKTQPFKYFVHIWTEEMKGITQTAIKCDTF